MTQQYDFDVVVIGGGATGGMLALALANQGYRVAMVEQAEGSPAPSNPERVVALSYGSRAYLQSLGVWDALAAHGFGAIRSIEVREPNQHGAMHMAAADQQLDALGYVVELSHLVQVLYQALADKVTVFDGAQVQTWNTNHQAASISIRHDGTQTQLTAALLIAADGTHSQMRRMAKIPCQGWEHNRFALVTSVRCERGHADTAYECFRKSGPLAFLPLSDDRFSIVWALAPQEATRMLQMPKRMFLNRLQRAADEAVLPRSGRILDCNRRVCFPLGLRVAQSYATERMVLIGNAAHTLHPVAGQGLNLGIRDIEVLTTLCSSEAAKQDVGAPMLLKTYAEQRRLDVLAVAGFTESMLSVFGNESGVLRWLRSKALDGLELRSPLHHLLVKHAAGVTQEGSAT